MRGLRQFVAKHDQLQANKGKKAKMEQQRKLQGVVRKFDGARGFGFISGQDGQQYFVHFTNIVGDDGYRTLNAGQDVEFEAEQQTKGLAAVNVTTL
jgi:cold shock protein